MLIIEPVDRLPLLFLFFTSAGIFIIAWRLLPHSNFFPIGLAMATLLAGALLVQQVVYAALLVEMAAILAVFPLHEPRTILQTETPSPAHKRRSVGGLRYMAYTTLALPGLMATHLLLELFAIFPNDLGLLNTARILLTLSFAILLGAVPFQSWLSSVAMDGSPPVVTFLFTVNIGTVWFMLLAYLQSYTWLSEQAVLGSLFNAVGLLMMVMGGLLAASQKQLGRFIGYATLVDNGAMMVALGTRQTAGVALAVMTLLARPFSLGLMTLGLQGLRRASLSWHASGGGDSADLMQGAAWRAPWRAIAFMTGGVALAGFPLSLGFTVRWGLYRLVSTQSLFQALLALSSSTMVMMGLVSAVRNLLTPVKETNGYPTDDGYTGDSTTTTEDRIVVVLILLLISATLILGLFPQVPSKVALQMAEGFTFFKP
jgi:formate hydrogenlyase subunit 3/multisubunit Na+/H+ antiporter MnhD subunit